MAVRRRLPRRLLPSESFGSVDAVGATAARSGVVVAWCAAGVVGAGDRGAAVAFGAALVGAVAAGVQCAAAVVPEFAGRGAGSAAAMVSQARPAPARSAATVRSERCPRRHLVPRDVRWEAIAVVGTPGGAGRERVLGRAGRVGRAVRRTCRRAGAAPALSRSSGAAVGPGLSAAPGADTPTSALVTLVGDLEPDAMPLLREALEGRLHDGVRTIDVDLAPVTYCGFSGLDALLGASQHAGMAGVALRLHQPPWSLTRLFDLIGTGFLVTGLACGRRVQTVLGAGLACGGFTGAGLVRPTSASARSAWRGKWASRRAAASRRAMRCWV